MTPPNIRDPCVLQPKLEAEEKRHRTKKRRFEQFYEPVKMLVKGLDTRRKRLKDMGRRIEAQVQSRFKHYMSQKVTILHLIRKR